MDSILVVDDTLTNLRLLIGLLSDSGYDVRAAQDGNFALNSVRSSPPDLILLDIKMPGLNGYEVCERLKADVNFRDIPVIFLSAMNEMPDKLKAFQVGGVDYVTKPFQDEEVLARVQTHLTLRRLQQGLEEKNAQLEQEIEKREQAEEELRVINERLKETNLQLQQSNQRLHEANASKDKFFSIVSHDLKGPFTGLIGLTGAIVENIEHYNQERLKKLMGRLHNSSKKIYTLLTNLLEWSRLQRGVMQCQPEKIVLRELVNHSVELLASHAECKRVHLSNLIEDDIYVYADMTMLAGLSRNLLSNALKFTAPGGTVEVLAQSYDEYVEVTFSDSGIGMAPALIDELFRIDAKSSRQGTDGEEGTGLGLILCKEFIEKNDGSLRVESEPGQGSRFIVTLPTPPPNLTNC